MVIFKTWLINYSESTFSQPTSIFAKGQPTRFPSKKRSAMSGTVLRIYKTQLTTTGVFLLGSGVRLASKIWKFLALCKLKHVTHGGDSYFNPALLEDVEKHGNKFQSQPAVFLEPF